MINIIHTSPRQARGQASLCGGITRGMKNHKRGIFSMRTDDTRLIRNAKPAEKPQKGIV